MPNPKLSPEATITAPRPGRGHRRLGRALLGLVLAAAVPAGIYAYLWLRFANGYHVRKTTEADAGLPALEVNGLRLHYVAVGDTGKPPLVAVHDGPGLDMRQMQPLLALANEFQVVLYDQRGTGLSQRLPAARACAALSLDSLALELWAVCQLLGHRPYVVAQGTGAHIVLRLLALRPDAFAAVVLLAPRQVVPQLPPAGAHRLQGPSPWQLGLAAYFEARHIRYVGDPWAPDDHRQNRLAPLRARYDGQCGVPATPDTLPLWRGSHQWVACTSESWLSGDNASDLLAPLSAEGCPIAVLAGACDTLWGKAAQQPFWRRLGNRVRWHSVPNAARYPLQENPTAAIGLIRTCTRSQ